MIDFYPLYEIHLLIPYTLLIFVSKHTGYIQQYFQFPTLQINPVIFCEGK